MLKAVSTYIYVKERLHPGLLDELVRSGAQAIEITPTASSTSAKSPNGSAPPAFP